MPNNPEEVETWFVFAKKTIAGEPDHPALGDVIRMTFGKLLCTLQLLAPQMIILLGIIMLACLWKKLNADLSQITTETPTEQLRLINKQYRDSHRILHVLNEAFSMIILVNCAVELLINVAIVAYLLRIGESRQDDSIQRIVFEAIGAGNMIFRISASIFCDEQAKAMRDRIKENLLFVDNKNKERVDYTKEFCNEIANNDNALSSAGCFLLNKEYVVKCCGLLLTYFLLVYQAWEGKHDNAELSKLILNSTAVLQEKIDNLIRHAPVH
ncbi:uncharacterized protein LOC129591866 [Paramacrobiotus metropolitanus]|uniref:uncharacterized protein LOC129591866 n=1 Tax=Paramacrobiotus metropolitanus TaxID=2943436 RepID=UPI002445C6AA|nr:uncharacterized protein LOC129591866 [Paramacrobiotus metropolitanus]